MITAKQFLLCLITVLSLIAIGLITYIAISFNTHTSVTLATVITTIVIAMICIIIAITGPLHATKKTLPSQPTHVFNIVGWGLLLIGLLLLLTCLSLLISSIIFTHITIIFAIIVTCWIVGLLAFGLLPFALSIPRKFTLKQMRGVIQTISATEMSYWTQDKREGLDKGREMISMGLFTLDLTPMALTQVVDHNNYTVIAFASYTCPQFRSRMSELSMLKKSYDHRSDVDFLLIYTAEAHPEDGWKLPDNFSDDPNYATHKADFMFYQAKSLEERQQTALTLINNTAFDWPIYLDNIDNQALKNYNSWPIRLYVIKDNTIVFCGDQGPFGFQPSDVTTVIKR